MLHTVRGAYNQTCRLFASWILWKVWQRVFFFLLTVQHIVSQWWKQPIELWRYMNTPAAAWILPLILFIPVAVQNHHCVEEISTVSRPLHSNKWQTINIIFWQQQDINILYFVYPSEILRSQTPELKPIVSVLSSLICSRLSHYSLQSIPLNIWAFRQNFLQTSNIDSALNS